MPKIHIASLVDVWQERISSNVHPDQICRTCDKGDQKRVIGCSVDEERERRIIDVRGNTTVVRTSDGTPVTPLPYPRASGIVALDRRPADAYASIYSCGQVIQSKCRKCARFVPVTATLPVGVTQSNRVQFRDVTLGGNCSIGPEGMLVGTEIKFCVPLPLGIDISDDRKESCATCQWSTSTYNIGMIEHATPIEYELGPYEMAMARSNAEEGRIGAAIAAARKRKGQTRFVAFRGSKKTTLAWTGLSRFYRLRLAPGKITYRTHHLPDGTTVEKPYSYTVVLEGTSEEVELFTDNADDRIGLITQIKPNQLLIQVHAPYYRLYNLPDRNEIRKKILPQEECGYCIKGVVNRPVYSYTPKGIVKTNRYFFCSVCDSAEPVPEQFLTEAMVRGVVVQSPKAEQYQGKRTAWPRRVINHDVSDAMITLVNPRCTNGCSVRWGPCYYHAKGGHKEVLSEWHRTRVDSDEVDYLAIDSELDQLDLVQRREAGTVPDYILDRRGEVVEETFYGFDHPSLPPRTLEHPSTILRLVGSGESTQVVDASDEPPLPAVITLRLRGLLAQTRDWGSYNAVLKAYFVATAGLPTGSTLRPNYAWTKESSQDPWHPFCSLNDYDAQHGGHPEGKPDPPVTIPGKYGRLPAPGVLKRGINMMLTWNDQFGTPRSDQSTNPIMHTESGGFIEVIGGAPVKEASGAPQHLMRDRQFSLPKAQDRSEWERVTSPGMRAQEAALLNEFLIETARSSGAILRKEGGEEHYVRYVPRDLIPWHSEVRFLPGVHHSSTMGRLKQSNLGWGLPAEVTFTFSSRQELLELLDKRAWIEGNEETQSAGAYYSYREIILGYSPHHNLRIRDFNIPSIAKTLDSPQSDPQTPEEENAESYVCTVDGEAFAAYEIDDPEMGCPSGDGGILVLRRGGHEWLSATMRADSDQIRNLTPDFRVVDDNLVSAPDTRSWHQKLRLEQMWCPKWAPRRRFTPTPRRPN